MVNVPASQDLIEVDSQWRSFSLSVRLQQGIRPHTLVVSRDLDGPRRSLADRSVGVIQAVLEPPLADAMLPQTVRRHVSRIASAVLTSAVPQIRQCMLRCMAINFLGGAGCTVDVSSGRSECEQAAVPPIAYALVVNLVNSAQQQQQQLAVRFSNHTSGRAAATGSLHCHIAISTVVLIHTWLFADNRPLSYCLTSLRRTGVLSYWRTHLTHSSAQNSVSTTQCKIVVLWSRLLSTQMHATLPVACFLPSMCLLTWERKTRAKRT